MDQGFEVKTTSDQNLTVIIYDKPLLRSTRTDAYRAVERQLATVNDDYADFTGGFAGYGTVLECECATGCHLECKSGTCCHR